MSSKPVPAWISGVQAASRALGVFSALMILVSIGVICQMVFTRAVLGQSSIWQTEFVMYALVAATFLGAPYLLLTRAHVAVDVLPLMVGPAARRWLHLVGSLIAVGFCGLFLYASVPWWLEAFEGNQTTSSMWRARLWIPYLSVPVGLGLLCLQYLAEIWLVITQREFPFGLAPEDRL